DDSATTLKERYLNRYEEVLLDRTVAYPGIPELLDALVEKRVLLGVLSNKPDASTQRIVSALFGNWPFAAVWGIKMEFPRNPDPAAALAMAKPMGVPPAECALVGDTAIDMKTALAAGMMPVGCAWGFRPEELKAAGAALVARRPAEILEVFV